jgi:hypothetical protein
MRKKASKSKAYLRGKKLLSGNHLDFTLQCLQGEMGKGFDSILIEEIPETLTKEFWENALHVCRMALNQNGKVYAILPRWGKILLPYEILRENELVTIYCIKK